MQEEITIATEAFDSLANHLLKLSRGHAETTDILTNLLYAASAPRTWVHMLSKYMHGAQLLNAILKRSSLGINRLAQYPAIVDEFYDYAHNAEAPLFDSSTPPAVQSDILAKAPIMNIIIALYDCQRAVREELQMLGDDWRRVCNHLPANAMVESLVDWLQAGFLPMLVDSEVWQPLRNMILDGLLLELHIQAPK